MNYPNWKEYFTQAITGYDPVEAQGLSELGFAIVQGQISENDYLGWARKSFEMMSVDLNFFQKQPPPLSLVKRYKDIYTWGPEILPVAEWDGHLIVLTLEKPKIEIPKELKPIVLLAPVSALNQFWLVCLDEMESSNSEGNSSGDEKLEIDSGGLLEGISLDAPTAVTGLDFSGIKPQLVGETTVLTEVTKVPSSTPNHNNGKVQSLGEKTVKVDNLPKILSPPPITEVSIEINTLIKPAAHVPKIPTSIPTSIPVSIPTSIPVAPPQNVANNEVKAEPKVIAVVNPSAQVSEGPVLQTLQQVSDIYEQRCYIEFNSSKKTALAQLWPAEMNITQQPTAVDLNKDSFLKIVAKTQKPYHGQLIPTDSTVQFFKEMNHGALPENVTVIPLIKSGEVVGAIMGWGSKTQYALHHLRNMEKIVNQLCLNMGFTPLDQAS